MGAHWHDDDASRRTALSLAPLLAVALIYFAGYRLGHSAGARNLGSKAALRAPADGVARDDANLPPRCADRPARSEADGGLGAGSEERAPSP
jgi:hypothetical protein